MRRFLLTLMLLVLCVSTPLVADYSRTSAVKNSSNCDLWVISDGEGEQAYSTLCQIGNNCTIMYNRNYTIETDGERDFVFRGNGNTKVTGQCPNNLRVVVTTSAATSNSSATLPPSDARAGTRAK